MALLSFSVNSSPTNWVDNLRRQYLKRSPETTKLGTPDDPIHWHELELPDKVRESFLQYYQFRKLPLSRGVY